MEEKERVEVDFREDFDRARRVGLEMMVEIIFESF